jgi:SAM-dependent methyltransferase
VSARIWNYWMGGTGYHQADKVAGDQFAALYPGIRDMAKASRLFGGRVVSFLAGEAGVRQFLDIGAGLPGNENTYDIVQRIAPGSRIVCVDNDPAVTAHARELLAGADHDTVRYADGDLNDPGSIIAAARSALDFTQPVAILLMGVLGHLEDPSPAVDILKAALPAGGYLALRDATDTVPAHVQALRSYEQTGAIPYRLRSPARITGLFDGLEAVEPGIVAVQRWRPDSRSSLLPADINMWGGAAIKR